jgi:hypothetical protein
MNMGLKLPIPDTRMKIPIPKPGQRAPEDTTDDKDKKIAELMKKLEDIKTQQISQQGGGQAESLIPSSEALNSSGQVLPPPIYPGPEKPETKTEYVPIPFEEYLAVELADMKELMKKILERLG